VPPFADSRQATVRAIFCDIQRTRHLLRAAPWLVREVDVDLGEEATAPMVIDMLR